MVQFNPHLGKDKGVHTFLKRNSLKMAVIVRLEVEPAYDDIAVQQVNHNTTRIPTNLGEGKLWIYTC